MLKRKLLKLKTENVKSVFRLDNHCLDCLSVFDNNVVFKIVNERATFIYSVFDEKPNFINSRKENNDNIFVEKITDNWYYACRQS